MRRRLGFVIVTAIVAVLAAGARADTLLRYKIAWSLAGPLAARTAAMPHLPKDMVIEIHGQTALTRMGSATTLFDRDSGQITLVDSAHHLYAVSSEADYAQQLAGALPTMAPGQQQAMAAMDVNVTHEDKGAGQPVLGFATQETDYTLHMGLDLAKLANRPLPPGAAAAAADFMRMQEQVWLATPAAVQSSAALRAVAAVARQQGKLFNPVAGLGSILPPQVSKKMSAMMQEMQQQGLPALRMSMALYLPMMAAMMQAEQQAHPEAKLPNLDANAPLMQMDMTVAQLAEQPLPGADFVVPAGYQKVSLAELIRAEHSNLTKP